MIIMIKLSIVKMSIDKVSDINRKLNFALPRNMGRE